VYFAERTTDGGLGVRLLVEGVITREQMHKATLQVSGVEHLGRMFERDTTIDRDAVELCVELMTDDVLHHVADTEVRGWRMQMYKRHPSGLDRWLPTRVEVVTHVVETPRLVPDDVVVAPGDGPRSRPHLSPPPVVDPVLKPAPAPAAAAPVAPAAPLPPPVTREHPVVPPPPVLEPQAPVEAPPVAAPVLESPVLDAPVVEEPVMETPVIEAHAERRETDHVARAMPEPEPNLEMIASTITTQLPVNDSGFHLADSAADAIMGSNIADEVAEAVRRALAAIEVPQ
jgi:hypothetical protein